MRNLAVVPEPQPVLSPVRAQLAHLLDRQREAVAKRSGIVAAVERLKQAEAAEATAKTALGTLDATEASAMVAWAETGGDMPLLDAEQRQRLMSDLAKASAMANAARTGGERVLAEAKEAQAGIDDLAAEAQHAIHGVLVAELDPVFEELDVIEKRRRVLLGTAVALGSLMRDGADRFDVSDVRRIPMLDRAVTIQSRVLPFMEPRMLVNAEVDPHKPVFQALAARLAIDPRAALEVK